ncbi:MAG: enoyl-CoA hydratase/isomerase family protein [Microthrixaceae bacterium]
MSYDLPPELTVGLDGAVRVVTINRPAAHNAVDAPLHNALTVVWQQLAADPDARAVVITGAGKAFSAGGDLEQLEAFAHDPVAREESLSEGVRLIDEMLQFPLPVIAAVNGPAVGLGCSLAVLCDIVLISDRAYLCDPHVSVGLAAGDGGAAFWPLLGPLLRSREYLFTGERIPAERAVDLGLASRVVPHDELHSEALDLGYRLAVLSPQALQGTKRVLNSYLARAMQGAVQDGIDAERTTMTSDEFRERVAEMRASQGSTSEGSSSEGSASQGPTLS